MRSTRLVAAVAALAPALTALASLSPSCHCEETRSPPRRRPLSPPETLPGEPCTPALAALLPAAEVVKTCAVTGRHAGQRRLPQGCVQVFDLAQGFRGIEVRLEDVSLEQAVGGAHTSPVAGVGEAAFIAHVTPRRHVLLLLAAGKTARLSADDSLCSGQQVVELGRLVARTLQAAGPEASPDPRSP